MTEKTEWKLAPDDGSQEFVEIFGNGADGLGGWYCVASEVSLEDAHLVAAAPDLLAALEAFVEMSSTDDVNAVIEQAVAAIAKAKGRSDG